jgi:hypothetical protein
MIGSGGLLVVIPHVFAVSVSVLLVGLPKKRSKITISHIQVQLFTFFATPPIKLKLQIGGN